MLYVILWRTDALCETTYGWNIVPADTKLFECFRRRLNKSMYFARWKITSMLGCLQLCFFVA